jgi:hypothetical protein
MSEWIVSVSVDTATGLDEQALVELADAAERRDASVSRRAARPGFTVTVGVTAADPLAAAQDGVRWVLDELAADRTGAVVDLRVTTPEQFETEALHPDFPELASAADAADILGVSRQRVHQLAASNTRFPAPIARVATGPLWTVPAIEHFAEVWERKPGRPAAAQRTPRIPRTPRAPRLPREPRSSRFAGE